MEQSKFLNLDKRPLRGHHLTELKEAEVKQKLTTTLTAAAILMAGCGSFKEGVRDGAATRPKDERAFLAELKEQPGTSRLVSFEDQSLVDSRNQVCTQLEAGIPKEAVTDQPNDSFESLPDLWSTIVRVAAKHCP